MKNNIAIKTVLLLLTLTTIWAAGTNTTGSTDSVSPSNTQSDLKTTDTSLITSSSLSSAPLPPPPSTSPQSPPPPSSLSPQVSTPTQAQTQAQTQSQTSDATQAVQQTTPVSTAAPSTSTSIVISSTTTSITPTSEPVVVVTSTATHLVPTPCVASPGDHTTFTCADSSSYCDTKDGNICKPKQSNGVQCANGAECLSGFCISNICSNQNGSSSNDSSSNNSSTDAKVGIAAGVIIGVLCAVLLAYWGFNRLITRRRSHFSRPNSYYSSSPEMESTLDYPFSGRIAGFSNTTAPAGHQRMGSMGDPTQRINPNTLPVPVAYTKTKHSQPSLSHMSFLPFTSGNNQGKLRNWDYSNDRYPAVGEAPQNQNNRISTVSAGSKLARYNLLTKAFSSMRASYASSFSRDTNPPTTPFKSEFQQADFDAQPSPVYNRESVNIVYRVANPEQEKDFRKNLVQAAKAIELDHPISTSKTTKAPSVDGDDDSSHLTTEPVRLGVGVDSLLESSDYNSSSANGRYKMSSMYSTYSHDGRLFSNLPEMPSVSSPVKNAFNVLDGKNKESDVTMNNVPRTSVSTLHAPIFKSYQAMSEVGSMPPTPQKYLVHQRNESETSTYSSQSKTTINNQHQREYSQSSLGPSPLGQSHSASKGSRESAGSKYSDSSSVYSTKSASRSGVNTDEPSTTNDRQPATASHNLDRHSILSSLSSLSDLSSSIDVEFDYVVPEMSTIEERIAAGELAISKSSSSTYTQSITSEAMDQDLDSIRQFAENAWDPNGTVSRGSSINTIRGRPTFAEEGRDPNYWI